MEQVKEEFNVCAEVKRQQEMIGYAVNITERLLQVLRGTTSNEDAECMKDECIFDTLRINSVNLSTLEKNLNEIARKVIG